MLTPALKSIADQDGSTNAEDSSSGPSRSVSRRSIARKAAKGRKGAVDPSKRQLQA